MHIPENLSADDWSRRTRSGAGFDPDIDLQVPAERREWSRRRELIPTIAIGGMIGASGRYAVVLALPSSANGWPWATLIINATGCLLIGLLMVWVAERATAHPLVRPFLGVGVLGGYTTFSTYAVESYQRLEGGHPLLGIGYLWITVLAAVGAALAGAYIGRWVARVSDRHRDSSQHHQARAGGGHVD